MTSLFFSATDRDPLDFNRTPAWVVELLIPHLGQPQTIFDAGCGDGAIGKVLRRAFHSAMLHGVEIDRARRSLAIDAARAAHEHLWPRDCANVNEYLEAHKGAVYNAVLGVDWTDTSRETERWLNKWGHHDLIISNPPFGLAALDFLRCAIARVRPGGTVAFLLPTHWDHDPDAKTEFARQRFLDSIRLPDGREGYAKLAIVGGGPNPCRPSFRGGPNTATDRYAWFMFGEKWAGQPSRRLHAIPKAETSTQLEMVQ